MRVAALLIALAGLAVAADERRPAKLPPDVQSAVDLAMAAPPEFAANALLRLVGEGKVIDAGAKREWIEQAFRLGGRAQHPVRLVALPDAVDTRAGYRANALRLRLDAVSLQARALELILPLDKAAAREWYRALRRPAVDALSCESALVPDYAAYYEILARLAQEAFTAPEGEKDSRLAFVQTVVDSIASHAEVTAAARMIASIDWTAAQFEMVSGAFVSKLGTLSPEDRAFSFAAAERESAIAALVIRARQLGTRPERIAEAYRSYLVANLSAPRCADNAGIRAQAAGSGPVELFGPELRGELAPLSADEIRPKSRTIGAEPKMERYWESAEAKQIFEQCLKLRNGPDGAFLPESARATREWKRQLGEFLNRLGSWHASAEESEEDLYHQKAIVYEALLEFTPAGDQRSRVLGEFVGFLKGSNVQQQNPVEWYWHVRSTLNRLKPAQPAEAQRLLAAFESSGNVVLALEAALERVAPDYSMFPK
jgi:hypothetical protein